MHCSSHFCSLRYNSKTSTNFFTFSPAVGVVNVLILAILTDVERYLVALIYISLMTYEASFHMLICYLYIFMNNILCAYLLSIYPLR